MPAATAAEGATSYRLDFAYDGSGFHGYAVQPGQRTVQGELEEALFKHTGPVVTTVAGRTDAGVHARGQVVSFESDEELDIERLQSSLNSMLAAEIVVLRASRAADGFSARYSASSRSYRYLVHNSEFPDPFRRHTAWHVRHELDLAAMNAAVAALVGRQDFASLCRKAPGRTTERDVFSTRWADLGDGLLAFDITASSFCHQMVRSIVALSIEVGRGRESSAAVPSIIAANDRNAAQGSAPAHGLTLWSVQYEEAM